ncbi:hypothetical protein D9M72_628570 [compost metagenome]
MARNEAETARERINGEFFGGIAVEEVGFDHQRTAGPDDEPRLIGKDDLHLARRSGNDLFA